jgi:Zn-dependent peptidase ImmA (M78 family)/transcriptional regulator with XRE-family HTH domain
MIDAVQLGNLLRLAREQCGLSQQTVADLLGLPRTAVSNMETGKRAVSTLELTKLAEIYRRSPAFFLDGDDDADSEDLSTVLHRAFPEIKQDIEIETGVFRVLDLYREGATLRSMLDQTIEQTVPSYSSKMRTVGDAIRQGETVAEEERRRLGLGTAPVSDIAALINKQGIWTAATNLPEGLSGLFINHPSVGLAILINARHWPVRRRFSCAHEYAHALFDRDEMVTTTRRENSSQLAEKRSNSFAAAFLMPAEGVAEQLRQLAKGHPSRLAQMIFDVANNVMIEEEIRSRPRSQAIAYQDVAALARHFGVSYEAAIWRLKSLNWITASETSALLDKKEVGKRYIRLLGFVDLLEEGQPVEERDQELRSQLMRLSVEAFRQGEISRGRLLEISAKLGVEGAELLELAEATDAD